MTKSIGCWNPGTGRFELEVVYESPGAISFGMLIGNGIRKLTSTLADLGRMREEQLWDAIEKLDSLENSQKATIELEFYMSSLGLPYGRMKIWRNKEKSVVEIQTVHSRHFLPVMDMEEIRSLRDILSDCLAEVAKDANA